MPFMFAQPTVTVKLNDLKSETVIVRHLDKSLRSIERMDTLQVTNGEFSYNVIGDKARVTQVIMPEAGAFVIYAVPGEHGVLTGSSKHAEWSGSKFYTDLAQVEKLTDPLNDELQAINSDFQAKVRAGANADSLRQVVLPAFTAKAEEISKIQMDYLKAHPNNDVCVTLLQEVSEPEEAMALLSPEVKLGKFSDLVAVFEQTIERQKAQAEASKKVAPGQMAPDFTLKTPEGTDLSLSQLRGTYVILDFWGAWCGWCIKGFPEMKTYYAKYKDKLEILGVDCNDTQEKWKEAINKYELPWRHVYNPQDSKLTTEYAIEGYPTKIIVGPDGKIVKTIVGEDPAFYTYLDELFK